MISSMTMNEVAGISYLRVSRFVTFTNSELSSQSKYKLLVVIEYNAIQEEEEQQRQGEEGEQPKDEGRADRSAYGAAEDQ